MNRSIMGRISLAIAATLALALPCLAAPTYIKVADAGFSVSGGFAATTSSNAIWSGPYRYQAGENGSPAKYAYFTFTGLTPGHTYSLAITWVRDPNRNTQTPWRVQDGGSAADQIGSAVTGAVSGTVNQENSPCGPIDGSGVSSQRVPWQYLGSYAPSGTSLSIRIGTGPVELASNDYSVADGARLQDVSETVTCSPVSGTATSNASWIPRAPNGSGDSLATGPVDMVIDQNMTLGQSSASFPAIQLPWGKSLTIGDGVTVKARGDVVMYMSAPMITAATRVGGYFPLSIGQGSTGGAIFEFDSSVAADPANTPWSILPAGTGQVNAIVKILGTSGNRAQIRSNAGGANGRFGLGGFINGVGNIDARHVDFTRIGDASTSAITTYPNNAGSVVSVQDASFADCGRAISTSAGLASAAEFVVKNVVITGTLGSTSMTVFSTAGTGSRLIDNLRADKLVQLTAITGMTVTNSVFAYYTTSGNAAALWQYNMAQSEVGGPDSIQDSYYFVDSNGDTFNAHCLVSCTSVVRSIFDCPRSTQGEMFNNGANNAVETTCLYNLMLPNSSNTGPGVLCVSQTKLSYIRAEHNTIVSTQGANGNAETGVATVGETMEGMGGVSSMKSNLVVTPSGKGLIFSRRNTNVYGDSLSVANASGNAGNNLVTATGANTKAVFGAQGGYADTALIGLTVKTFATAGAFTLKCYHSNGSTFAETASIPGTASGSDILAAVLAAFNTLGDGTYAGTTGGQAPNAVSGTQLSLTRNGVAFDYARINTALRPGGTNTTGSYLLTSVPMYSVTPAGLGATDMTVPDLAFVDTTRNVATFDTAYLGNSATAWADGQNYAVGDIRSASDSGAFGGLTINYRCINAHTSAVAHATNGKPNTATTGTAWRTNWEYAGAYRLRVSGAVYNAGIAQATPRDLITWVKAGWAPTTASIATAGHDGTTIGAVAYVPANGTSIRRIINQLMRRRRGAFMVPAPTEILDTRHRISIKRAA